MQLTKIVPATRLAAIQNVRPAHPNAVFFPSARIKNVRYKPNFPTETQAIPARTQSNQTLRRSGDERQHRNRTNYIPVNPRQPNQPRRSGQPREEVERCRRDRRRAPQSPSPISLTAPARREADASGQLTNRIPDKQTRKPEATAPILLYISRPPPDSPESADTAPVCAIRP